MLSKEEAVTQIKSLPKDKQNQQAIVSLMAGIGTTERIVHVIPGGAKLTEYEDEASLPTTVFNWIRLRNEFERIEISLVGDYGSYEELSGLGFKPRKEKVIDFQHSPGGPTFWAKKGLRHLADLIAQQLFSDGSPITVIVEKEGLFVIKDASETLSPEHASWKPTVIMHKLKRH